MTEVPADLRPRICRRNGAWTVLFHPDSPYGQVTQARTHADLLNAQAVQRKTVERWIEQRQAELNEDRPLRDFNVQKEHNTRWVDMPPVEHAWITRLYHQLARFVG